MSTSEEEHEPPLFLRLLPLERGFAFLAAQAKEISDEGCAKVIKAFA